MIASIRRILYRTYAFFRKKPLDENLAAEIASHLEFAIEDNITRGLSEVEARRQALLRFGGVQWAKEEQRSERGLPQVDILLQDLRYALRGFRRNPIFTLTIVVTLMLGIGATTAVFSIVDRILFRSLPYAHADRLVSVGMAHSLETQAFLMGNFYYDWRDNQKPFEAMTSEQTGTHACDLTEQNPVQLSCESVEGNFLPTLGISPVLGRNFLPEEARPGGPRVALLSYGLWLTHYSRDPGILNKTVEIDGSRAQVVGVLPKDFEMPRLQPINVLFPMIVDETADRTANGGYGRPRRAFARLKPGVSLQQAQAELQPLFQNELKLVPSSFRSDFHLKILSLRDRQMQDVHLTAWILLSTAFAVLMIACANVASLLMARGEMRRQELAVRSALGASRIRLARQALTEAFILSIVGAIAGGALAEGLLRLFISIAPASIPYLNKIQLDLRIICFTVFLSIACGALFGLTSALQKPDREALSGRSFIFVSHPSLRQWLVVAQIAASIVLLTVAALMLRSFWNLQHQQLGMRDDNTVTVSVTLGEHNYFTPASKMRFFQQLATRLRFGPGVNAVSMSDSLPPATGHDGRRYDAILISGRPPSASGASTVVRERWVSPEYFRALDIPILRGEAFREGDLNSSDHFVVLSQQLAGRLFPDESPIGKRLNFDHAIDPNAPWYTVIGVAANVKNSGLTGEEDPEFYVLKRNRKEDWTGHGILDQTAVVVVRSSLSPQKLSPWIRAQVATIDPTLPIDISTLKQRVSKLADAPRFQTILVGLFALTGLMLAMIGLYGVIAFFVAQRTQEIGVRMALGAGRGSIVRLVLRKSVRLILWGNVIGLAVSLALSHLLRSLLFQLGSGDPITFVSVSVLLMVVALLATLIPAWSAMKVNPIEALRRD